MYKYICTIQWVLIVYTGLFLHEKIWSEVVGGAKIRKTENDICLKIWVRSSSGSQMDKKRLSTQFK